MDIQARDLKLYVTVGLNRIFKQFAMTQVDET